MIKFHRPIILISVLKLAACSHSISSSGGHQLHKRVQNPSQLPNPNSKKEIVEKLGFPAEVFISDGSIPAISGPSYSWAYYLEYSSTQSLIRAVYSFQNSKSVGSPSLGFLGNGEYRVLSPDSSDDLLRIVSFRR